VSFPTVSRRGPFTRFADPGLVDQSYIGMVHTVKPSVDLEGAEGQTISRRSPRLIVRPSRENLAGTPQDASSPRSPAFHSPQYIPPPSPVTNAAHHWSTLPPSPPRSTPPSPPLVVIDSQSLPPVSRRDIQRGAYPTPPGSTPGSIRSRRGFETGTSILSLFPVPTRR